MVESDDRGALVIATGHDITERRQAEAAQRVRELAAHLQSAREAERKRLAREMEREAQPSRGERQPGYRLPVGQGSGVGDAR